MMGKITPEDPWAPHTLSPWEVPTIGTVVGELEETTQALLRAQPQTSRVGLRV